MAVAPGSILTWLAIREVLKKRNIKSSTLLDAGCGDAWMTKKLIRSGIIRGGIALEPSQHAHTRAQQQLAPYGGVIRCNQKALNEFTTEEMFDVGCALMVIEHLEDDVGFVRRLSSNVRRGGWVLIAVPAGVNKWTYEDDLVGHLRRYNQNSLEKVMHEAGLLAELKIVEVGFPLLNLTERIRNWVLRRRHPLSMESLSLVERTENSGVWNKRWINSFPGLGLFINGFTMYPFHLLQRALKERDKSVVLMGIALVD